MKPNTKMIYTETVANPLMGVADVAGLAKVAHDHGARLVVDNTFMTGALFRPLDWGADIVVNSLTKFANGHSDVICGAATGNAADINHIHNLQVLIGSQADPFASWLTLRGIRTVNLRLKQASKNALALAKALEASPYVEEVKYPGLESHPQHEIAHKQFGENYGGMMGIVLPEDRKKMDVFMRNLHFAHYAGTLGGTCTSFAYPPLSSHSSWTKEERLAVGITDGLLRISVGIEETEDLVADFLQALEVAYGG